MWWSALVRLVTAYGPWAVRVATEALALKEIWDWFSSGNASAPAPASVNARNLDSIAERAEALQAERVSDDDVDEFCLLEKEIETLKLYYCS